MCKSWLEILMPLLSGYSFSYHVLKLPGIAVIAVEESMWESIENLLYQLETQVHYKISARQPLLIQIFTEKKCNMFLKMHCLVTGVGNSQRIPAKAWVFMTSSPFSAFCGLSQIPSYLQRTWSECLIYAEIRETHQTVDPCNFLPLAILNCGR